MKKLILILGILVTLTALGQKQGNVWYFGIGAGIDFNSGAPVALNDGAINQSEGCASIADKNGNILFYTDGITVWDSTHSPMQNGTGLKGDVTSTQSAVIVPQPNSELYYVFTSGSGPYATPNEGVRYSIVDMSLNGGQGDVVIKNQLLLFPASEKLTAVKHFNGTDSWIIAHEWDTDSFYSWTLKDTGLDTIPVISSIGSIHGGHNNNSVGYMKTSPDGSKLALAIHYDFKFELFDFDNNTGIITNPITLSSTGRPYGVEFSPDNNLLYVTTTGANPTETLYQYSLMAGGGNPDSIKASKALISSSNANFAALQLAPDGKIYVAISNTENRDSLGVINSPNVIGTGCDFVQNGIYLLGNLSTMGLPNFLTSYFNNAPITSIDKIASQIGSYNIYPNPFSVSATLHVNNVSIKSCSLTIYDIHGQIVRIIQGIRSSEVVIERGNLSQGLYLFQLRDKLELVASGKMMVE